MKKQYDVEENKAIRCKKLGTINKPSKHLKSKFLMKNIKEFNDFEPLEPPVGRRRAPRTFFEDIFSE